MPNIEIHGVITGRETSLRAQIFELLKDEPFATDVVVSVECTATITEDSSREKKPFLRVFDSDGGRAYKIGALLSGALRMDVETMQLRSFHHA